MVYFDELEWSNYEEAPFTQLKQFVYVKRSGKQWGNIWSYYRLVWSAFGVTPPGNFLQLIFFFPSSFFEHLFFEKKREEEKLRSEYWVPWWLTLTPKSLSLFISIAPPISHVNPLGLLGWCEIFIIYKLEDSWISNCWYLLYNILKIPGWRKKAFFISITRLETATRKITTTFLTLGRFEALLFLYL